MTLRQTAALDRFGDELIREPTGSAATVRGQVMQEAGRRRIGDVLESVNEAGAAAEGRFDAAAGTLERQQRALGQPMSESERRVQQRRIGLGRALSSVDARNREVANLRNRTDIARTGAAGLRDILEGQVLQGRGAAAQAEGAREQQYQRELAEYRQKKRAGLGQLAAIGLSFVPGGAFLAPAVSGAIANG